MTKIKKLIKKMKNEKVAKGRIISLAGPCFLRQRARLWAHLGGREKMKSHCELCKF